MDNTNYFNVSCETVIAGNKKQFHACVNVLRSKLVKSEAIRLMTLATACLKVRSDVEATDLLSSASTDKNECH